MRYPRQPGSPEMRRFFAATDALERFLDETIAKAGTMVGKPFRIRRRNDGWVLEGQSIMTDGTWGWTEDFFSRSKGQVIDNLKTRVASRHGIQHWLDHRNEIVEIQD